MSTIQEKKCEICSVLSASCDCDKCGIHGCYDCVFNINLNEEDINVCDNCYGEEEEEICPSCGEEWTDATRCDCPNEEEESNQLDMKVLGFLTTERLDGDWNSLLFEIRNHEFEE